MRSDLGLFAERIMAIRFSDVMLGGGADPRSDMLLRLRSSTAEFISCCERGDGMGIERSSATLEGALLGLESIGCLSAIESNRLIDRLHELAVTAGCAGTGEPVD